MTDYAKRDQIEGFLTGELDIYEVEVISKPQLEDLYDDWIDELSTVEIGNLSYDASRVLKEIDPIAYRTGFNDFTDAEEYDEIPAELERALESN